MAQQGLSLQQQGVSRNLRIWDSGIQLQHWDKLQDWRSCFRMAVLEEDNQRHSRSLCCTVDPKFVERDAAAQPTDFPAFEIRMVMSQTRKVHTLLLIVRSTSDSSWW